MSRFYPWLIVYLSVGVMYVLGTLLYHKVLCPHEEGLKDMMGKLDYPNGKPLDKRIKDTLIFLTALPVLVLFWPFIAGMQMHDMVRIGRIENAGTKMPERKFFANLSNLQHRLSVDEIEGAEMVDAAPEVVPSVPFGFLNLAWASFKEKVEEGDEIWSFALMPQASRNPTEGPTETSDNRPDGYAVVRQGQIVAEFHSHHLGYPELEEFRALLKQRQKDC